MKEFTGGAAEIITFLLSAQKEKPDAVWEIREHKERRSLDSNAYFHVLCDKLRQKLGISFARCKNHLIADYGQVQYIEDGVPMIYKTNAPEDYMQELETIHTKCVKVAIENDREVYFYRVYRGSHEYDSSEMSALISGTVDECRIQGIQTATPDELAHMAMLWERRYERGHEKDMMSISGR